MPNAIKMFFVLLFNNMYLPEYQGSRCKVKFENNSLEEFDVTVELKQGNCLSVTLFKNTLKERYTYSVG